MYVLFGQTGMRLRGRAPQPAAWNPGPALGLMKEGGGVRSVWTTALSPLLFSAPTRQVWAAGELTAREAVPSCAKTLLTSLKSNPGHPGTWRAMGGSALINHLPPRKSILLTGSLGGLPLGTTCCLH